MTNGGREDGANVDCHLHNAYDKVKSAKARKKDFGG